MCVFHKDTRSLQLIIEMVKDACKDGGCFVAKGYHQLILLFSQVNYYDQDDKGLERSRFKGWTQRHAFLN